MDLLYIPHRLKNDLFLLDGNSDNKDNIAMIERIASLSKGDEVTLVGTIDGRSIHVGVDDCRFK